MGHHHFSLYRQLAGGGKLRGAISRTPQLCSLLNFLSLRVNKDKSCLIPFQSVQFIGTLLDSVVGKALLPVDRPSKIALMVHQVKSQPTSSAQAIQRLLGHMVATTAMLRFAKYHMRLLQLWFLCHFSPHWHPQSQHLKLPSMVLDTLDWWSNVANITEGVPFQSPIPLCTVSTEASLWGWGADLDGLTMGGTGESSHKRPRADGNLLGPKVLPASVGGDGGVSSHRQHHSTQLRKQTRWNHLSGTSVFWPWIFGDPGTWIFGARNMESALLLHMS